MDGWIDSKIDSIYGRAREGGRGCWPPHLGHFQTDLESFLALSCSSLGLGKKSDGSCGKAVLPWSSWWLSPIRQRFS